MAKTYVKFEVSKEVSEKALEAVRLAKQNGTVRKGVNEVTKSIERGLSTLVILAEDIDPEEVVMHIPNLCEQKKINFVYVPTKLELGKALGMSVPCSSVAIEKPGDAQSTINDVVSRITGKSSGKSEEAHEKKVEVKKEKKEHKEEKQKPNKEEKEETKA
ncbi:MAG: 50S ribosomal protein L7Ae [Candidatus Micrarchaeaceae archaeon]